MIIKVKREKNINGAIPSKIYVNGAFFGYGLENDLYKIPLGRYAIYSMVSPKFGTHKIYIDVPDRTGILFHGGNKKEETKGCILTGAERAGEFVKNDVSTKLYEVVTAAAANGEKIEGVYIEEEKKFWPYLLILAAGLVVLQKQVKE